MTNKRQRIRKKFTEIPQKGSVDVDYYYRMLSPKAIRISRHYEKEEEKVLKEFLLKTSNAKDINFIAVGAGELWYLKLGLKYTHHYISIEPLTKLFLNENVRYLVKQFKSITLIEKKFEDVEKNDIKPGNSIYVFLFNIIAYIENPISKINKLLREGDILFISTWNNTTKAKDLRRKYFNYLNSFEKKVIINPDGTVGLCHLDDFPFQSLKYYKSHRRFTGEIIDILIIYT